MTAHQRNVSVPIDPVKLDRLAEVAVKVGLRLQPGQVKAVTIELQPDATAEKTGCGMPVGTVIKP